MQALTELDAAGARLRPAPELPWSTPRRRRRRALAALWGEATETYALMARVRPPFWGGF